MKAKLLLLVIAISASVLSFGQTVGINTESPNKLTELDIRNIVNGTDTIPKGIMIPRMSTVLRDAIDVNDSSIANSLLIYNTDEDCFNYYSRLENEWQSLCGKLGKAEFSIRDCNAVKVVGQYMDKTALGTGQYLVVPITVTKPGTYNITAIPDPSNGYYFTTSGEFLSAGTFDIVVPAAGTPTLFTPSGQQGNFVKISLNGVYSGCSVNVIIEDSSVKPAYVMDCRSVTVNGVYRQNIALDNTNTITMNITVDPAAIGAKYNISTNTVDGITFSATGILTNVGTQLITLRGNGKPTSMDAKRFIITSNSSTDVSTCNATVTVAYRKMTMLSIGTFANSSYGYNFSGTGSNSSKFISAQSNFGLLPTSIVKAEPYQWLRTGDFAPNDAALKTELDKKPDIVIVGVWWNPTDVQAQYLVDYLAKGGVVLSFMEETGEITFLKKIFADNSITGTLVNSAGAVYRLPYVNDEVLNGPFGDIRGKQWGEDASQTRAISGIPSNLITTYSNDEDISQGIVGTGKVTAFRHNTLNLIFVADGGFNSSSHMDINSKILCPFNINASNYPITKLAYGRGTNKFDVYNSIFTANAIAWAFRQAQFNGINSY